MHSVLSEADVLVYQNGDAFDLKKLNTRFIQLGLPPLAKKQTVDTLKIARREFKFTSNRLDYISKALGGKGKIDTPKGLWLDVIKGKPGALKTMVEYNKGDVAGLIDVYLKMKPFIKNHPNANLTGDTEGCPNCGSAKQKRKGYAYTRTGAYPRFICLSCGAGYQGTKSVARVRYK